MGFLSGHALVVGVGNYIHASAMAVPTAATDAQAVATVLCDPNYCGYSPEHVTLLDGSHPTKDGILTALDSLAARTTEQDTVVFFYCGRGDYGNDGVYYLTSHDTEFADGKVVAGTGVSQHELLDKFRKLSAKRALFVFNACHSGEISPTLGSDSGFVGHNLPEPTAAALLATGEGRIVITACREGQVSFIGNGSLTIFTQALVDGLRGNGTISHRGYISAFDLYNHLYFTVSETTEELIHESVRSRYGGTQEPELTVLKGGGSFAVSLYRGATNLGQFTAPVQPPEGAAVRQVSQRRSQIQLQQMLQAQGNITKGKNLTNVIFERIAAPLSLDIKISQLVGLSGLFEDSKLPGDTPIKGPRPSGDSEEDGTTD